MTVQDFPYNKGVSAIMGAEMYSWPFLEEITVCILIRQTGFLDPQLFQKRETEQ